MAIERVPCPHCQSGAVVKYGTTANGKTRFRCQPTVGCGRTFIRVYAYQGRVPLVKQQIVELTLNGSGVRDTARVLRISPTTVIGELKKRRCPSPMSTKQWSRVAVQKGSP